MADSPEDIVRAFYAAWDTDGFGPAFRHFFHDDGVWQNNADPPRIGIDAIMQGVERYLSVFQRPYARVELTGLAASGDVVLTERIEHCESRERDDTYTGHHMAAFTIRDGKILRWADYFDPTDYLNGTALPKG